MVSGSERHTRKYGHVSADIFALMISGSNLIWWQRWNLWLIRVSLIYLKVMEWNCEKL